MGQRAIDKLRQQHMGAKAVDRYVRWCDAHGLRASHRLTMEGYRSKVGPAERKRFVAAMRRLATEDNDPYGGGFQPNSDPSQRPPSNSVGKGGTPAPVETPPPNPMPNIVPPGPAQVGPWPVYGAPGNNTAGDIPGMIGLPTVPGMGFQQHGALSTEYGTPERKIVEAVSESIYDRLDAKLRQAWNAGQQIVARPAYPFKGPLEPEEISSRAWADKAYADAPSFEEFNGAQHQPDEQMSWDLMGPQKHDPSYHPGEHVMARVKTAWDVNGPLPGPGQRFEPTHQFLQEQREELLRKEREERFGATKPVNHAEEAAKAQWRKMDSSLSAKGYKYDKAAGHWTKPGARPVKNHWPIKASWSRLTASLDARQLRASDGDLLKAEGDEISTIGEYTDFADKARAQGNDAAANTFDDIISDEREHVQKFDDQLDRVATRDDWQPVVQGKYVYPGSEGFRPKADDHSQCKHPDACVVQHPELLKKKQSSRKQAWTGWGPSVFPKTRQVDGWEWNNHLNGYVSNTPQRFACDCGNSFDTPTGFQRCACGKQWNSYVIGTGGSNREASAEKFLVREIPVRDNVIVASREASGFRPDKGYDFSSPEFADTARNYAEQHAPKGKMLSPAQARQEQFDTWRANGWNGDPDNPRSYPGSGYPESFAAYGEHRSSIYKLTEPGELEDGEDDGRPTMKSTPSDWHRRDKNQRWTKAARRG